MALAVKYARLLKGFLFPERVMGKGCEEKPLRGRITVVLEVGNFIQTLNISPPIKTLWLNCIDLIVCPFLEWCFKCTANIFI